ncbi:tartrate-resistant acid phosphatase type 5 precursor [Trypanosoma rangeli]|uniref:acid phosphatase n=1 Tax=Trypanosoma rangeli TaxID=5698 RepID=A0A422NIS1_TRYRA|nr:tartrate-resistant acid phosphatase type 5 precursor [Trypanosoma rangeli]RNF05373.1 tartrate-resistant acid phosphatase type 5 precursor [Trypanosoma rangeli]|eukprot:RNF05373.1 tartrate-resistant acid phosphatase type 5 precursor [Trypanosoma rangeli]
MPTGVCGRDPQLCLPGVVAAVVLFVVGIVALTVDAAIPGVPLAEVVFAPYNLHPVVEEAASTTAGGEEVDDFCFISHGCWGGKPSKQKQQKEIAALIVRLIEDAARHPQRQDERIRFVVAAGDNFYPHGVRDVHDTRFFTTFEGVYSGGSEVQRVPWLVALGNHDHLGNWSAQVSYTYATREPTPHERRGFNLTPNGTAVTGRWYMPHPYYVVKVSNDMVVVVLDTVLMHSCNEHPDACWDAGKQKAVVEDWLLRMYANVPYKVVVGHYPVLSNGPHENYPWLQDWLIPLLTRSCASLYIHADNHYLQVSKRGFQYYANSGGGGGAGLHHSFKDKSWMHRDSVFHSVETGVMVHCKKGNRLTHRVLSKTGDVLFRFASWDSDDGAPLAQCLAKLMEGAATRPQRVREDGLLVLLPPVALLPLLLLLFFVSAKRQYRLRGRRRV